MFRLFIKKLYINFDVAPAGILDLLRIIEFECIAKITRFVLNMRLMVYNLLYEKCTITLENLLLYEKCNI